LYDACYLEKLRPMRHASRRQWAASSLGRRNTFWS